MTYDVIIIGAGPGGIFSAYELMQAGVEGSCAGGWQPAGKAALSHRR